MNIKSLIRKEILEQEGYQADITSCTIKLDANENPFPIPLFLKEKLFAEMKKVSLNRYPEPGSFLIRKRFAEYFGVHADMVTIGNGSDELIHILCNTLVNSSSVVMVPKPTFVMYRIIALNSGHKVTEVPLDSSFDLDLNKMLERISITSPVLLFLGYPNSPTGNCFSIEKIETIIDKSKGIVIVDEAYGGFSGKTLVPLLEKYDNLAILKTLSKVGLAAMRIGFLIASPLLIQELDKVRLPYNINALSQVAAGFYMDHIDTFSDQTKEVIERRKELFNALRKLKGIHPYPSESNFIFFSCDFDTDSIYSFLVQEGILIKNLNSPGILKNCMRVTVGTREENEKFLNALKKVLLK